MDDDAAFARAWIAAAEDLGIEAIVPADVKAGAVEVHAIALLPQFGGPNGMVVFGRFGWEHDWIREIGTPLVDAGYGVSHVAWTTYRREWFVNALNDWGWNSDDPAPDWYTGEPDVD